jgi:hypothetical protein
MWHMVTINNGDRPMTHKIHLRQGVNGTTACASRGVRKNGKIIRNRRSTYQHMSVEAVRPVEFRAVPADQRCAHCCDRFTPMMNARRAKAGLPLYADAMTQTLA